MKSIQNPSIQNNIIPEIEYKELKEKSEKIIELLPPRQKQIYKLSREKGLTYKEIANKLSISVNTVETHMERALRLIRKNLGEVSISLLILYYLFI